MATSWTPERRAKQSAAVHRWKLWEKSTGPKTPEGKATSAGNSRKHGMRSREGIQELQQLRELLAQCKETIG